MNRLPKFSVVGGKDFRKPPVEKPPETEEVFDIRMLIELWEEFMRDTSMATVAITEQDRESVKSLTAEELYGNLPLTIVNDQRAYRKALLEEVYQRSQLGDYSPRV